MKVNCATGTPDQMIEQFKGRISELEGIGIDSSFDYPDDLEALENGEYESHVTEPINAEYDIDVDLPTEEVLNFLANKGYDTSNKEVINYADAVAEYIDMCRQAWHDTGERFTYTLSHWYRDTLQNYPHELEDLPKIESCDSIMSASEFAVDDKIVKQVREFFKAAVEDMESNIIMQLASKVNDYDADWASEDISDPAAEDVEAAENNLVEALVKFAFSNLP